MTPVLLQVSPFPHIYNERLAIIFGLITVFCGVLAFFSCRTCIGWLGTFGLQNITKSKGYASFNKKHIYYWWGFGVFLGAHIMVAVVHSGFPQSGDPDAYIRWVILGLGLFSAAAAFGLFASCRVVPRLAAMAAPKNLFENALFKSYFQYDSYFWWILLLLVAVHFTLAFNYIGLWPGLPNFK
jgi:hypothetical protein